MSEFNPAFEALRRSLIDARKRLVKAADEYEATLSQFRYRYPYAVIPKEGKAVRR